MALSSQGWCYCLEESEYYLFPPGENTNQHFLNLGGSTREHSILCAVTKGLESMTSSHRYCFIPDAVIRML